MNLTKQTLNLYWQHAKRYPKFLIGLIFVVPLSTLGLRIVPPLIAAEIVRRLAERDYISGDVWGSFGNEIIFYILLVILGGVVLTRLEIYLVWKLETYVNRDILRTMFNQYMRLDAGFHADSFGGSLVSRANKLVNSYLRFADSLVFQFVPMITSFVAIIFIMYPKSSEFVWALIVFSIIFTWLTFIFSKSVRILASEEANAENRNTGAMADAVTNIMAIKSFAALSTERKKFEDVTDFTRNRAIAVMWATIRRDFVASIITTIIGIMALVVAIIAIVNQDANLATVFLMLTYTGIICDKLWEFQSSVLRNFNRSMGDAYEAVLILMREPKVVDLKKPEKLKIKQGNITFKNVVFDHEDLDQEKDALFHNLNLDIKSGEKIGLVGRSGGGKTTITKLLLRYMDIDAGEILIDGQNIAKITQDDLRSAITYVPQEPLLFHRSLAENINYGNPAASEKGVIDVAKRAHAHEFIKDLPNGYETLVGERGVKLSGGQRQRIAIARAMIKNAPILLLDEATSALDSESEKLIQDALWKLMEGKTAIVIAHRLSTIQRMDRIVVLEDGEVVEQGSHKKLLANKGTYSTLWKHQSGGFLED